PVVKKWKENAINILKSYYLRLRGIQFVKYRCSEDKDLLLGRICFSMFGPPSSEKDVKLCEAYEPKQKQSGQEILDKIIKVSAPVRVTNNVFNPNPDNLDLEVTTTCAC